MAFISHTPSPPLSFYINSFYSPMESVPLPREKILPLPGLDLKINFGGGFQVYDADQSELLTTLTESWVLGLWTKSHIVDWPKDLQYVGVNFKPGGAYPFLGMCLTELENQIVPLDAIWGTFAAELRERLYAACTIQARFALLEKFLLARLHDTTCFAKQNTVRFRGAPQGLRSVQYAVEELARCHGALSIHELSENMGMSQKHLIVQFKQMVGCTPKELGRLYRFGDILASINPTEAVDWTQVAHQFYFHDQSHFIRDFKEFSGHSPSDYLRLLRQLYAEKPDRTQHLRLLPVG